MLLKQKGRFRREKGTPEAPGGTFRSVRRAVFGGKSAQGCTGAGGVGLEWLIELRMPSAWVARSVFLAKRTSIRPTLAWAIELGLPAGLNPIHITHDLAVGDFHWFCIRDAGA